MQIKSRCNTVVNNRIPLLRSLPPLLLHYRIQILVTLGSVSRAKMALAVLRCALAGHGELCVGTSGRARMPVSSAKNWDFLHMVRT